MTENITDILELKCDGNGVKPDNVKASEIGALISEFETAILSTVKHENPEIDITELLICFDSIKDESIGIFLRSNIDKVKPEILKLVSASYLILNTCIFTNDYTRLPTQAITSLKRIQSFAKRHEGQARFKYNGEQLSVIDARSEIKAIGQTFIKGDTTIYGELFDVGGDNPNIHIKINNDYNVIIETDRQQTKELASRLYDTVGLRGFAKWDLVTSRILEFKLYDVIDYKPGNIKNTLDKLRDLSSGVWDNYNTNDEINNQLLRD